MRRLLSLLVLPSLIIPTVVMSLASGAGVASAAVTSTGERGGFSPGGAFLWGSDTDVARDLDAMASSGAKWVRVDFDWPSIQPSGPASFNWSNTDRIVNGIVSRGMSVLALPTYSPGWARPAGTSDKTPPSNPADFANFVRAAVIRYAPLGVHHWEVWNEPNGNQFWSPKPDAAAYTRLLQAAAPAIRGADATATVLSGGLMPAVDSGDGSHISPTTFVTRMYTAGAKGSFDAVAVHPYSYPAMPNDTSTMSWNTFQRMSIIHDTMVSNGDGAKQIWSTEYGAPTGTSSVSVSESTQAQMVTAAFDQLSKWSWAGPLMWYAYRDEGTNIASADDNFGLARRDGTPKVAWATFIATMAAGGAALPPPAVGAAGGAALPTPAPPKPALPVGPDATAGGYVVDAWGGLHGFSTNGTTRPPDTTGGPYWPGWDIARGVALDGVGGGGYVLDGWGGLHSFGIGTHGAPAPVTGGPYWAGWDIARGVALLPDGSGGYVLDGWGGLHGFGIGGHPAPAPASTGAYWAGWDIARGVTILPDGSGGYVVDGWGGLHPFGLGGHAAPPAAKTTAYWPGWTVARGVAALDDGNGGYVLDGWGGLHGFGVGGHAMPGAPVDSTYWTGWDVARGVSVP